MLDRKNFIINGAIAIGALTLYRCFAFAKADVYHSLRPPLAKRKFVSKAIDAEIAKIKAQIAELEKENEKLLRTNQELTICWKESAKMLKSVSKSVAVETKRMQKLMKQKH